MLSLTLSLISLIIFFRLSRISPAFKLAKIGTIVSFNILFIELIAYIYILALAFQSNCLFLIGHQTVLDSIIKRQLTREIYTRPESHQGFYQVDDKIGYTLGKNKKYYLYESNSEGIRSSKEYSPEPDPNTLRLAVFGDSFVFCDGEREKNSWPYILERSIGNLEVMNFGVSGYGLGQSYLRYLHEGVKFKPDVVFFNYTETTNRELIEDEPMPHVNLKRSTMYSVAFRMEGNDLITESFTPLKFFNSDFREKHVYAPLQLNSKEKLLRTPLFSYFNSGILIQNFVFQKKHEKMAKQERSYQRNLTYTLKIISSILEISRQNHTFVIFCSMRKFDDLPQELQNLFRRNSRFVTYIDLNQIFNNILTNLNIESSRILNASSHYNAIGNRIYAEAFSAAFKRNIWGSDNRRFRYDPAQNAFIHAN